MSIEQRPLGATGLMVSEIGFGALEIGRDWAADVNPDPSHCSEAEAARVLNGLLDLGVNFIDTAPAYWDSEEFIGSAIAGRRNEYILATKVGEQCDRSGSVYDYSHKATLEFIDRSLARLKTDRIDLLQIHSASIEVLERGETFAAMDEARRAGKVLHIGMTGGVESCVRALEIGGYETVQFPYNLLNLQAEAKLLDLCREKNAGAILMRGLAGGKLSAKFANLPDGPLKEAIGGFLQFCPEPEKLASLALAYVLNRPEVSSVIAGSRRLETVRGNIEAAAGHPWPPSVIDQAGEYARTLQVQAW